MRLLSYEQPARNWWCQTLLGCEDRGFAIGVLLTAVLEFKTEEGPIYPFWKFGGVFFFDTCKDCLLGEFNRKVFLFGFYFDLTLQENRLENITSLDDWQMFCGLVVVELLM